jgi:hypothetical protein
MKGNRYFEEQIIGILKAHEAGAKNSRKNPALTVLRQAQDIIVAYKTMILKVYFPTHGLRSIPGT